MNGGSIWGLPGMKNEETRNTPYLWTETVFHPWTDGKSLVPVEGSLASAEAFQRIFSDVTLGVLPPGMKLKVRELKEVYGISATPLREALAQLAARGYVLFEDRKGYSVPPVSLGELNDLSQSRQIVEGEALRLSIIHGDAAWEGLVLSYLHQLKRERDRADPSSQEWLNIYERRHYFFHRALIAACPYTFLKEFCDSLYIKMTRYRRLLQVHEFSERIKRGGHGPIVDAALARNSDLAVPLLREHLNITATLMASYLEKNKEVEAVGGKQ